MWQKANVQHELRIVAIARINSRRCVVSNFGIQPAIGYRKRAVRALFLQPDSFEFDLSPDLGFLLSATGRRPYTMTRKNSQKKTSAVSRRDFLSAAAVGLGSAALPLLSGCNDAPSSADSGKSPPKIAPTSGVATASDAPEVSDIRFGMIALTDCSPIVIAHEKGIFKKYGINSTVIKGAGWPPIRDQLINNDIQATHLLLGIAIASTIGIGGTAGGGVAQKVPIYVPWLMNRNGQSITLKKDWKGKVADDPKAIKPLADEAKAAGKPLMFAMTYPTGTHAMWMRYYLGAGGINPDTDVSLKPIPPAQMVANMKVGQMDGYCVESLGMLARSLKTSASRRSILKTSGRIIRKRSAHSKANSQIRIPRPSRLCSKRCTKPVSGSTTWTTGPSSVRSFRPPHTSTATRTLSSAACKASTTLAMVARKTTPTT